MAGFLGIHFNKVTNDDGNVEQIALTQTGLIKRILVATGMEDCSKIGMSSETKALKKY